MGTEVKLVGVPQKFLGIPATDIVAGDVIVWDYGVKEKVIEVLPNKSGKTILVTVKQFKDDSVVQKIIRSSKLLVIEHKSEPIDYALLYRKITGDNFFEEINEALQPFPTSELIKYVTGRLNEEEQLRNYIEQRIASSEIMKLKHETK